MAGCEFNRQLEMDKYVDNKASYGERFARQYLKTNMAHYRAKEAGQAVPSWDVYLTEKGLTTAGGEGLLELTEQPLTSHLSAQVSSDIKLRVPVEMETVRHANALAFSGADTILMPEHISENGGIFVRFVTRYKRDSTDPNKYQGSQIDLGKNMLPEEARNKMQDMMGRARLIQSLQSNTYKDAYAFALHEKANISTDIVQGNRKMMHERGEFTSRDNVKKYVEPDEMHSVVANTRMTRLDIEEKNDHLVLEQTSNKIHKINVFRDVVTEGVNIGRKVVTDTKATLVAAGLFALETLKKRKKKNEGRTPVSLVGKTRSVFARNTDKGNIVMGEKERPSIVTPLKELLHHTDPRIREAGKRFMTRVVARWQEMNATRSLFAFASESSVGIGVALFGLRFMTRELPKAPETQYLERTFRRMEKADTAKERKKMQKPVRAGTLRGLIAGVKKEKRGAKPSRVIEMARRGFVFKKGEARVAVKETIVRVAKPVERLWKIARRLARRAERLKGQYVRTEFPQAVSLRKREIVLSFSFAWSLWALLFLSRNEHKQQDPHIFIYEKTRMSKQELTESDSQPWILFAIIWHLAMIREQGLRNYPINQLSNTTNSQIKKRKQRFALRAGVIFAYTPPAEHSLERDFAVALAS